MRPRESPASPEAFELLKRAQNLLEKAEKLDMVEHEGKKVPAFAADGKGAKDETKKADKCPECGSKLEKGNCMMKAGCTMSKYGMMEKASMAEKDKYCMKNFGKKYSECSEKQKAQCDKVHGKVEKGEHHKAQSFDFNPGHVQFMSETGGQTFNAYYTTNQSLLDSEDVANKGATSQSVNLEPLNARQNPHDNPAPGHQIEG